MFYEGSRRGVPSSHYGGLIDVMEAMGWTWQQLCDAPADLVDEIGIMLVERARAQKRAAERK